MTRKLGLAWYFSICLNLLMLSTNSNAQECYIGNVGGHCVNASIPNICPGEFEYEGCPRYSDGHFVLYLKFANLINIEYVLCEHILFNWVLRTRKTLFQKAYRG